MTRTGWRARVDDVAALLLAAMFGTFILQVMSRYVFNAPLEWTLEVCLTTWLWAVLWGSAFCLRPQDHIRFDMLHQAASPRLRRVFAGLGALAVIAAMLAALPGTWDFVSFLTIKKSASLRVPLAYVFAIYLVFMMATAMVYAAELRRLLPGGHAGPGTDG